MVHHELRSSAGLRSGNGALELRHSSPAAAASLLGNLLLYTSPAAAATAAAAVILPQLQLWRCQSLPGVSMTGHHMAA